MKVLSNIHTNLIHRFKSFLVCCCLLLCSLTAHAMYDSTSKIMIVDKAGILSASELNNLENKLEDYQAKTHHAIIVWIENGATGNDAGQLWKDGDSAVLLSLDPGKQVASIKAGPILSSKLTEEICRDIITRILEPSFKDRKYYEGINKALEAISGSIEGNYKVKPKLDPQYSFDSFVVPVCIFLLLMSLMIYINLRNERRIRNTMHSFDLSNEDARILLGYDRPTEPRGGGWKEFKGGGAAGGW